MGRYIKAGSSETVDEIQGVVLINPATGQPGGGGGGGGGSSDTTEATQLLVKAAVENLDADVGSPATSAAPADGSGNYTIIGALKRALLNGAAMLGLFGAGLPKQLSASGALMIGNNRNKLRDEFPAGGLNPNLWDLVSTGAGMTITTGNGTTGSYLNINSGTSINAETIIRSKESFTLPVRLAAFVTASQRIANTEFFVELIEVDPATGNPINTSPAQTNAGVWRNHASIKFDGTSATSAIVTARSGGAPEFVTAASTIVTTVATGTGPNFFPAGYVEMQASGEHVALLQNAVDSTAQAAVARRVTQAAPNPDAVYKLQFRLRNLGTAPASATDYRVHTIRLFDFTRLTAEIIGGPGHSGAGMGAPVNATQSGTWSFAIAASQTLTNLTNLLGGQAAHDAVIAGAPLRIGARAVTANYTAVASGDAADLIATTVGAQVTRPYSIPELDWQASVNLTGNTAVALQAAAGVGLKRYATSLTLQNKSATVATEVQVLRGTTVVWGPFAFPVNSPIVNVPLPTPLQTAANEALNVQALTTGSSIQVSSVGFTAP